MNLVRPFSLLLVLLFFGFGCKPSPAPVPLSPVVTSTQDVARPTTRAPRTRVLKDEERLPSQAVMHLRQVMQQFALQSSFRVNLTLATPLGSATGSMTFHRKNGFHGRIRIANSIEQEIISVEPDIYLRTGTSSWINVGLTENGNAIRELFARAHELGRDDRDQPISESAQILSTTEDKTAGCTRTIFQQYNTNGNKETWNICVANDLPREITIPTPDGPSTFRYSDFRVPFVIQRPLF